MSDGLPNNKRSRRWRALVIMLSESDNGPKSQERCEELAWAILNTLDKVH